ncbi:helix-turn-helix transcriptional regulator [Nocardia sp. NPDC127526]|uniref:helix-turn-helix transcriptional regulator n=1 Tax=Nocardia sp. NPDC127526 TaxID=3345393 RepID=UPI0036371E88
MRDVTAPSPRRTELAALLRSRRDRLSPTQVGIAPGLRRRTPGLRREEVAGLAGVSVTWYTWLEQGRPINVGAHILDAITEYPAAAINTRWDLLGCNKSAAALWPRLTAPDSSRNVLWKLFTTPADRRCFVNRAAGLPHMVASFRADFANHLDDPAWTDLIRALATASPEFTRLWASHDVAAPPTQTMTYRHATVGDLSLTLTRMELPATPEKFYPVIETASRPSATVAGPIVAAAVAVHRCSRDRRERREPGVSRHCSVRRAHPARGEH